MKATRAQHQLELFDNPRREWTLKLIKTLEENSDKINRMNDLVQKVLSGKPGYAKPAHVRWMSQRRRLLALGRATIIGHAIYVPPKGCKPHLCPNYTCNDLAGGAPSDSRT